MMKECLRLIPLIRLELPGLPRRHDTDYAVPRIGSKFGECLCSVDNEVAMIG